MSSLTEYLIRNSDNQIALTLTEDGVAISGAWTALDIFIEDVQITRASDGDGVALNTSTGVLTITPANLLSAEKTLLDALPARKRYKTVIVVTSATNDDGVVFGGPGATPLFFHISDKPTG